MNLGRRGGGENGLGGAEGEETVVEMYHRREFLKRFH